MSHWIVTHPGNDAPDWVMRACGAEAKIATFYDGTLAVKTRHGLELAKPGDRLIREDEDGTLRVCQRVV